MFDGLDFFFKRKFRNKENKMTAGIKYQLRV